MKLSSGGVVEAGVEAGEVEAERDFSYNPDL